MECDKHEVSVASVMVSKSKIRVGYGYKTNKKAILVRESLVRDVGNTISGITSSHTAQK